MIRQESNSNKSVESLFVTKRRILMVGEIDFSKDDAPKIHFFNLAINFDKLGYRTRVLVYSPQNKLREEETSLININFVPNPLTGNKISRSFKYLLIIPFVVFEIFSFKPHLVYFRFSPPAFLYTFIIKLYRFFSCNYKIVVEFNDWVSDQRKIQGESKFKAKIIEFLQLRSVFFVDYARVVTQGIKRKLCSFKVVCDKIFVVENGTDVNHFKPINRSKAKTNIGLNPDFLYVGFIGNFAIWQGLETFLNSIPRILKIRGNVRFILVGDGPEMRKIRNKISRFKNKEVVLTGRVPYKEAGKYINAFDIGVAPFIRERNESIGLSPLKIRDYAACGVPIITTRISGLEIVEKKEIGLLVPPDDSDTLSAAIIKLIENPALRKKMGKKGRKVAEELFSWEFIAKKILKMIKT